MKKRCGISVTLGRPREEISLGALRAAYSAVPAPDCPLPNLGKLSDLEREAWQDLQARTIPGSPADVDLAGLLACFGVDYRRNVRRLLRCRTFATVASGDRGTRGRIPIDPQSLRHVADHLARVYARWSDPEVLEHLLCRCAPDRQGRVARNEALLALWDGHWEAILRAASGSAKKARSVADALAHATRVAPDPFIRHAYMRRLRQAVWGRDNELRLAALAILILLRQRCSPMRKAHTRR